jgi:hypothetical protein
MPRKQFSVISWQKKKLPFDEMVTHDVTFAQLLIVVWKMSTFSEGRFVGVLEAEPPTDIDHSHP